MSFLRTPTESPLYAGPADDRLRAVLADPRSAGLAPAGTLDATGAEPDPVYEPFADLVAR